MDMQAMPMKDMHNTFWREGQVVVAFRSTTPLVSSDGQNQGGLILEELNLERQRRQLNDFLAENGLPYTLNFYQPIEYQEPVPSRPLEEPDFVQEPGQPGHTQESPLARERRILYRHAGARSNAGFTPPPGIYLLGLVEPIQSEFGEIVTNAVVFFDFTLAGGGAHAAMSSSMPGMEGSTQSGDANGDGDGNGEKQQGPVVQIVNALNNGLYTLNTQAVPVSGTCPNWLHAATGNPDAFVPQGCPLIPPIPVEDACSFWHFHLPLLSPEPLRHMTGEEVTVFVLDSLPERGVIAHAATRAGDDNLLLFDVNRNVTFNYDVWNQWMAENGDPVIPPMAESKDVYGRHYIVKMPDHGLYIAGIVHDIAPHARVECVRMLGDFCVGDSTLFLMTLQYIQNRMLPGGDLYRRPVVINLSNVMPTIAEAKSEGLNPNEGVPDSVLKAVYYSLLALTQHGAIIVASAGNEADLREDPTGQRPPALHPAAFGNPPLASGGYSLPGLHGVIPVGAVDKNGNAASYSCYPGPNGVATYGGEVPFVDPAEPPSKDPYVIVSDALRGIYSSPRYPALSQDDAAPNEPVPQHKAPNDRGWAYWIGTSFATPIISAVTARVLEWKLRGGPVGNVRAAVVAAGGGTQTLWNDLDPAIGVAGGQTMGPMLLAVQECQIMDKDDED